MQNAATFGIYVNIEDKKVVRINSPYWIPEEPDWRLLTPEVNATLLQIRQMAREKNILEDTDSLTWGAMPLRE